MGSNPRPILVHSRHLTIGLVFLLTFAFGQFLLIYSGYHVQVRVFIPLTLGLAIMSIMASMSIYFQKFLVREVFLLQIYRYREVSWWFSLIYASGLSVMAYGALLIFEKPAGLDLDDRTLASLTIGIFTTLMIGLWGLVITYNVLHQQRKLNIGFDSFLNDVIYELRRLSEAVGSGNDKIQHEVFIYDYHPLIGNVSSPVKFEQYKEVLDHVRGMSNIGLNVITYHEDSLAPFFARLSIGDETKIILKTEDVRDYLRDFEYKGKTRLHKHTSIWKTNEVGPFHFIIIGKVAFQYVVIPVDDKKNTVHTVYGIKTEDVFTIDYLRKTFDDMLRNSLAPSGISYDKNLQSYCLKFIGQSNIEKIELFSENQEEPFKTILKDDKEFRFAEIQSKSDGTKDREFQGLVIRDEELLRHPYFNLRFVKRNGVRSVHTKYIYYKDLFLKKPTSKTVTYLSPKLGDDLKSQYNNCVEQLELLKRDSESYQRILRLTVFVDLLGGKDEHEWLARELEQVAGGVPASIVCQTPGLNKKVSLEVLRSNNPTLSSSDIEYKDFESVRYTVMRHNGGKELIIAGLNSFGLDLSLGEAIRSCFDKSRALLQSEGLDYSDVIRQWAYIGKITEIDLIDGKRVQRYQVFNHVREEFFDACNIRKGEYPVSTGIGMNVEGFCLDLMAMESKGLKQKTIENPAQINPYNYTDEVLVGDPLGSTDRKARPLFERARLVCGDGFKYYLVSGTASIRKQDTHTESHRPLRSQTDETVKSINAVLNAMEGEFKVSIKNLSYLRIVYSSKIDYSEISRHLDPIVSSIPHIYLQSDICRQGLFLEIEGARF